MRRNEVRSSTLRVPSAASAGLQTPLQGVWRRRCRIRRVPQAPGTSRANTLTFALALSNGTPCQCARVHVMGIHRRTSNSRKTAFQASGFALRRRSPTDSGRHGTGTREECASSKYSNPALAPSLPRDCMSMLWHALIADAHGRRRCGGRFPLGHGGRWMPSPSDTLENHHHQDSGRWRWRFDDARWRVWA